MTALTVGDMMAAYAEDAIDFAKQKYGVHLDGSRESVEKVEAMAEKLYRSIPRGRLGKLFAQGPSEQELITICKMLGGYIGEVFRGAKGGEWSINEQFSAIGIQRGGSWIFPPAKVHKRLTNGVEDNLWSYFRIVVEEPWGQGDA